MIDVIQYYGTKFFQENVTQSLQPISIGGFREFEFALQQIGCSQVVKSIFQTEEPSI